MKELKKHLIATVEKLQTELKLRDATVEKLRKELSQVRSILQETLEEKEENREPTLEEMLAAGRGPVEGRASICKNSNCW